MSKVKESLADHLNAALCGFVEQPSLPGEPSVVYSAPDSIEMPTDPKSQAPTPIPWTIQAENDIYAKRRNSDGKFVDVMIAWVNTAYPEWEADAAFIVRACNNHEKLIDALDNLLKQTVDQDLAHGIELTEGEKEARAKALAAFAKIEAESPSADGNPPVGLFSWSQSFTGGPLSPLPSLRSVRFVRVPDGCRLSAWTSAIRITGRSKTAST